MDRRTVRWPLKAAPPQDGHWGRPPPRGEAGINARLDRLRVEVARLNNGDNHRRNSGPGLMERGGAYGKGAPARRTREGDGWRQRTATCSDGKPPWAADGVARTYGGVEETTGDEELHGHPRVKTDDLPEGWEALEDEEGNIYFHHVPTDATQWESPLKDEQHEEATMPPVEEAEPAAATQPSQHEDSTATMQEEGHAESKREEEPEACHEDEEQAPRPVRQNDWLLPDWEEVEDVEGGVYYHHIPTGHTQWEPPRRDALAKDMQSEVADSSAPPDAWSSSNHKGASSL